MKQIVHIFKKDVRHHWPEIVLSLVALALYIWNEPRQWLPNYDYLGDRTRNYITGTIDVGVVLSWCVLIVRIVQSESLVGDRQFWTTRPYEWKKLLAAKVLFVAIFVNLAVLIAGLVLMYKAGMGAPLSSIPRLLWQQLNSPIVVLLPVAALAAVTPNFGQFILALLGVGAYTAGVGIISTYVPSQDFSSGSDTLQQLVLFSGCLYAIIWQYARRKTGKSRIVLTGAALTILLLVVATPYQTLIAREYPQLKAEESPVQLAFDTVKPAPPKIGPDKEDEIEIKVPLDVSGIAPGNEVSLNGAMLTIEDPDGRHWNTGWKNVYQHLLPADLKFQLSFKIKKNFFDSTQSNPVNARISLAFTALRDMETRRFIATAGEFTVPDIGLCSINPEYLRTSLRCRFMFHTASGIATISSSEITCPEFKHRQLPELTAHEWYGGGDADFISPVQTTAISFITWDNFGTLDSVTRTRISPSVCPGTPILLTKQDVLKRGRTEIQINGIRLSDYRVDNIFSFGFVRSR